MIQRVVAVFFLMALPLVGQAEELAIAEIRSLLQNGQAQTALEQLNRYRKNNGADADSLFLSANAQATLHDDDAAIATYQSLIKQYPTLPEPYNNLAALQARNGRLQEAQDTLLAAIKLHPSYATVYDNLTKIYATRASIAYKKALEQTELDVAPRSPLAVLDTLQQASDSAPATTASVAPTPAAKTRDIAAEKRLLIDTLKQWAKAWSKQDVGAYLAYYSPTFVLPDEVTRAAWENYRAERLKEPKFIDVTISQPKVHVLGEGQAASVYFMQSYRSDTFNDKVQKLLVLEKSGEQWKIVQEEAVN